MNALAAIEDARVRSWNKCNTSLPPEDFRDLVNNIITLTNGKLPKYETIDRLLSEITEQTIMIKEVAQESRENKNLKMQDYINEQKRIVHRAQKSLDDKNKKTNALFQRILDTDATNLRKITACEISLKNLKNIYSLYYSIQEDVPYLTTNYNNMKKIKAVYEYNEQINYMKSKIFVSNEKKNEQIDQIKKEIAKEEHKTYTILPQGSNSFIKNGKEYENKVKELLDFCNKNKIDDCDKVLLNLQRIRCWNVYFKSHNKLVTKLIEAFENINIDKSKLKPISFNSQKIELSFRQKVEQIVTHTLINDESLSIESFFQKCIQNATGIKKETQSDISPLSPSLAPPPLTPPPLTPPSLSPPPLSPPPLSPPSLSPHPLSPSSPAISVSSSPAISVSSDPLSISELTPHKSLMTTIQCRSMSDGKLSTVKEEAEEEMSKREICATAAIQTPVKLNTLLKRILENCKVDEKYTASCKKIEEIYTKTGEVSIPVSTIQTPNKWRPASPKKIEEDIEGHLVNALKERFMKLNSDTETDDFD